MSYRKLIICQKLHMAGDRVGPMGHLYSIPYLIQVRQVEPFVL